MLAYPYEILQNHHFAIEVMKMQNISCGSAMRLLRVAASSNPSINPDWRDKAAPAGYVKR
jgi:hypothetical protein